MTGTVYNVVTTRVQGRAVAMRGLGEFGRPPPPHRRRERAVSELPSRSGGLKANIRRVGTPVVGASRVVLGMLAFLLGFLVLAGGVFTAFLGARTQVLAYFATAKAPSVVEMLGAAAAGCGWACSSPWVDSCCSGSRIASIPTARCAPAGPSAKA